MSDFCWYITYISNTFVNITYPSFWLENVMLTTLQVKAFFWVQAFWVQVDWNKRKCYFMNFSVLLWQRKSCWDEVVEFIQHYRLPLFDSSLKFRNIWNWNGSYLTRVIRVILIKCKNRVCWTFLFFPTFITWLLVLLRTTFDAILKDFSEISQSQSVEHIQFAMRGTDTTDHLRYLFSVFFRNLFMSILVYIIIPFIWLWKANTSFSPWLPIATFFPFL